MAVIARVTFVNAGVLAMYILLSGDISTTSGMIATKSFLTDKS